MADDSLIRRLIVRYLRIVIPQIELSPARIGTRGLVAALAGARELRSTRVAKIKKSGAARVASAAPAPAKKRSFEPDRKGESSAGALASKDKKRAVAARRDGANTR